MKIGCISLYKLIFGCALFVLTINSFAQQTQPNFSAFGHTPKVVHDDLYLALQNAQIGEERLKILDSIANEYRRPSDADSLLYYGFAIKRELINLESNYLLIKTYKLKSLFYNGLGSQKMGLLDDAIAYFIEGLDSEINDEFIKNQFKLELVETYLLKRNQPNTTRLLEELSSTLKDETLKLQYNALQSEYYIINREYNKAKQLINSSLALKHIDKHLKLKLRLQALLFDIKIIEEKYSEALLFSSELKSQALNQGFYDIYTDVILNEGRVYEITNEYTIAEMALNSAYVNSIQWNRLELQRKINAALVKLYVAKGNFENAYNLKTQLDAVNKTIADNQNARLVRDLEFKYESLQNEKKIDSLQEDQLIKQAEIERQKTIKYAFLIGFLVILIPIILLLVVYYQKLQTQSLLNKQRETLNQQELKSVLQTQELELAKNTISVQNQERDRIARELHDSIGGNIAGIKLQMNSLAKNNTEAEQLLEQLDKTYEQVRDISHSLIPKEFKENSFTIIVNNYIQSLYQDDDVVINFDAYPEDAVNRLNYELQSTLLNITKELIANAFKHARASQIDIQITSIEDENSIELLYEDDGIGFNVDQTNKGIGLNNIEHRIKAFNGKLFIDSAKHRGTVITISIPQNTK